MPAKSAAQKRLMDAAAHNPAFAKKVGIPTKVAKEYSQASKGQTFKEGGIMKVEKKVAGTAMGKVRTAAPSRDGIVTKGHTRGKQVKMAGGKGMKKGGMTKGCK